MPRAAIAVVVLAVSLAGCASAPVVADPVPPTAAPPVPSPSPTLAVPDPITFLSVIDGDTIRTSAGTVRIIGIDTPERGECGHDEASAEIGRLLSRGDPVTLVLPRGQNDQDRHGRLLRYVITADGVDLGMRQIQAGHAIAKYDSTDGYPAHPNEAAYHAAQIASPGPDRTVITTSCQPAALVPVVPQTKDTDRWWQLYTSCAKLKKNTAGHTTGPFARDKPAEAEIYDWFAHRTGNRGDGDGDGLACE